MKIRLILICFTLLFAGLAIEVDAQKKKFSVQQKQPVKNKPHTKGTISGNAKKFHKSTAKKKKASTKTTTAKTTTSKTPAVKTVKKDSVSQPVVASNNEAVPAATNPDLKGLKIVIVIGDDHVDHMKDYQKEHQVDVDYLKNLGCHVTFFHPPDATWEDITKAAAGADIFVYSGHGGAPESLMMYISSGYISPDMIRADLKLAKNAVVLFNHVCYSAGSSAGDDSEIGEKEAARRVRMYAEPFVTNGAAVYYANNYSKSTISIMKEYFANKPFADIVKAPVYWEWSDGRIEGSGQSVELIVSEPYSVPQYDLGVYRDKERRESEQYTYVNGSTTPIIKKLPPMYDYGVAYVIRKDFSFSKRK